MSTESTLKKLRKQYKFQIQNNGNSDKIKELKKCIEKLENNQEEEVYKGTINID